MVASDIPGRGRLTEKDVRPLTGTAPGEKPWGGAIPGMGTAREVAESLIATLQEYGWTVGFDETGGSYTLVGTRDQSHMTIRIADGIRLV